MTALLTALRDNGRQAGLVQRPRCRVHVASIRLGESHWITLCDRDVLARGATFWEHDATEVVDDLADQLCQQCNRMIVLAALLTARSQVSSAAVAWRVAQ